MRTAAPTTAELLLLQLRELTHDVSGDAQVRARRLALLRRYERHERAEPRAPRPAAAAGV